MHRINFCWIVEEFSWVDHLLSYWVRFLVERILNELLLEPEVLELLLLFALTFQVWGCVHKAQFAHLFTLLMINWDFLQDALSCLNLWIVAFVFFSQEICSLVCCSSEAFIASVESFCVLLLMVIDSHISPFVQVSRLLLSQVELIVNFFALIKKLSIRDVFILPVNVALSLKLIHALLTNFFNCSISSFLLAMRIPLNRLKSFLGFKSRTVEVFFSLSLFALCELHWDPQL